MMTATSLDLTVRQQIMAHLCQETYSARELSQLVRVPEKEVYNHLAHIARSVSLQKKRLVTIPCRCLTCGYLFRERRRFSKPGRCPRCRAERIQEPRFQIR